MNFRIFFLTLILCFTGCSLNCDYDEEVKNVKSLSEKQLKEIFEFVKKYSHTIENDFTSESVEGENFDIPHLKYIFGGISKNRAHLILGGCMDDKAIINIKGYGESLKEKNKPVITLFWGEGSTFEKVELWNGE